MCVGFATHLYRFLNSSADPNDSSGLFFQRWYLTLLKMIFKLVETDRVLAAFRHNPREQYRKFVEGKISHMEQELLIRKDIKEDDMWLPW